jgi:hypothetical protein
MSKFGFSFEERIDAEGANYWSSFDFITGMQFNGKPQIVEVTGSRLPKPRAELPPWAFTTDHGGWTLAPERGGGPSVIGVPRPIDLVPHTENLVKAIVSRDPIGVLEVGISIFIEMAQNSRTGYAGLSQIAMP